MFLSARRRRIFGVLLSLVMLGGGMAAGAILYLEREVGHQSVVRDAAPSDAVVVLGCSVYPDGRPTPEIAARTKEGVRIWRETRSPLLLVTGGIVTQGPPEATVMGRLAKEQGVPSRAILEECAALSTWDSARICARMAREKGWQRVTIVSDPPHLLRARVLFQEAGISDVRQSPADESPAAWDAAYRRRMTRKEAIKLAGYYLLSRLGITLGDENRQPSC
jgi:uncharacterized SAM-binding protein YcdF (DUF218 family)